MLEARVNWTDADRFVGTASSSHALVTDAGERKTASSPLELVLIGLCACTCSDLVSILRKKREAFTAVEVRAQTERAPEPPTVFTKIRLVYKVTGKVARKSIEDAIRLSQQKYCSVSAMLQKTATITTEIETG